MLQIISYFDTIDTLLYVGDGVFYAKLYFLYEEEK